MVSLDRNLMKKKLEKVHAQGFPGNPETPPATRLDGDSIKSVCPFDVLPQKTAQI